MYQHRQWQWRGRLDPMNSDAKHTDTDNTDRCTHTHTHVQMQTVAMLKAIEPHDLLSYNIYTHDNVHTYIFIYIFIYLHV